MSPYQGPIVSDHSISPLAASRLESLRGLAAMQVAMFHCLLVVESCAIGQSLVPPAITVFNGQAAVTLFFVLSGFVLGLSLRRSTTSPSHIYGTFALRRLGRIYPAFLAVTFLTCVFLGISSGMRQPTASTWVNDYFPDSITSRSLLRNLLLIDHTINKVTWTLRMEMFCSMLLPLIYLAGRLSRSLPLMMCLGSVALAFSSPNIVSIVVIPAFLIGYVLPSTQFFWPKLHRPHWSGLALVAALLAFLLPRSHSSYLPLVTLLETSGAVILIGMIAHGAHQRVFVVLDRRFAKLAGRVSFSYYLIHPVCLIAVCQVCLDWLLATEWHPVVIAAILWAASSAISFPLAWLSYEWIEIPSIGLSKRLWPQNPGQKICSHLGKTVRAHASNKTDAP